MLVDTSEGTFLLCMIKFSIEYILITLFIVSMISGSTISDNGVVIVLVQVVHGTNRAIFATAPLTSHIHMIRILSQNLLPKSCG